MDWNSTVLLAFSKDVSLSFEFRGMPVGEEREVLTESREQKSYIDFNTVYQVSSFKKIHAGNMEDFH